MTRLDRVMNYAMPLWGLLTLTYCSILGRWAAGIALALMIFMVDCFRVYVLYLRTEKRPDDDE